MKRTVMIQKEIYQNISLGDLTIPELNLNTEYSSTAPYIKRGEDIEISLRHPYAFREKQPIELNGFAVPAILKKSITLQEDLQDEGTQSSPTPYEAFTSNHPLLVSYPPEVFWAAQKDGIKDFIKSLKLILPQTEFGFSPKQIGKIIEEIITTVSSKPETYAFWTNIIKKEIEKESLSKILMEWAIQNTILSRGKWIAAPTPLIDSSTLGSISLSHRINLAYGYLIDDKQNAGQKVPAPFYTLNLSSSMIQPDSWSPALEEITRMTRLAMAEEKFDGICLYVRGLQRVSSSNGRVNTLLRLIREVNAISKEALIPTWYSRFSFAGMRALDMGASFASFPINLNIDDVYKDGFPSEPLNKYGKVVNPTMREIWNRDQVIQAKRGPDGGLPHLEKYCNKNAPTTFEEESSKKYRVYFSKPYNIACFSYLNDEWLNNVRAGESAPGREYLRSFEAPFNAWGN